MSNIGRHVYLIILLMSCCITCGLNILSTQWVRLLPPTKCFRITSCSLFMCRITGHRRSIIKYFREHVLELNKEGLVPKLICNVHLFPKYVELVKKEVSELNEFLQFHEKLVSGNDVSSGECQCSRMYAARVNLTKYEVKSEEVSST